MLSFRVSILCMVGVDEIGSIYIIDLIGVGCIQKP